MSSVEKITEIKARCDQAIDPNFQGREIWESRREAAADILFLLQALEVRDQQIGILTNAEYIRRLLGDFSSLSDTRRVLVLELMREMRDL